MDYTQVSTKEEIKIISDLAYLLFPLDYGGYVSENHIQYFLDRYQSEFAIADQIENKHEYFLIQERDVVAGYFGFEIDGKVLKLSKLYLVIVARNKGLGRDAMHWLKKYAIEKGCNQLELLVLIENEKAIRFYEKLGYVIAETFEEHFNKGYSETNYRMTQKIIE